LFFPKIDLLEKFILQLLESFDIVWVKRRSVYGDSIKIKPLNFETQSFKIFKLELSIHLAVALLRIFQADVKNERSSAKID